MIRTSPLETRQLTLPSGNAIIVPTADETLRIKSFLIVRRNQVRDYLDTAALSDRYGIGPSARVLRDIDSYYSDHSSEGATVASQLVRQLGNVRPKDSRTIERLPSYKGLARRWTDWDEITRVCGEVAAAMLARDDQ